MAHDPYARTREYVRENIDDTHRLFGNLLGIVDTNDHPRAKAFIAEYDRIKKERQA